MVVRVGEGCKGFGGFRNEGFRKFNKVIKNTITMSMPLTCHTGEMSGLACSRLCILGFDMFFFSLIDESIFISIHIGWFFFIFLVFLVKSVGVDVEIATRLLS